MALGPAQPPVGGPNEDLPQVDYLLCNPAHGERGSCMCSNHTFQLRWCTALRQRFERLLYADRTSVAMQLRVPVVGDLFPRAACHNSGNSNEFLSFLLRYPLSSHSRRGGFSGRLSRSFFSLVCDSAHKEGRLMSALLDSRHTVVWPHGDRGGVLYAFEGDGGPSQRGRWARWGNRLSHQFEFASFTRTENVPVRHKFAGNCRGIAESSCSVRSRRKVGIRPDLCGGRTGASGQQRNGSESNDFHKLALVMSGDEGNKSCDPQESRQQSFATIPVNIPMVTDEPIDHCRHDDRQTEEFECFSRDFGGSHGDFLCSSSYRLTPAQLNPLFCATSISRVHPTTAAFFAPGGLCA